MLLSHARLYGQLNHGCYERILIFVTRKTAGWSVTEFPKERVKVSLLYVIAPLALKIERERCVLLDSHIRVGIVARHLFAAIAPQAFQSVPKRFLSVHLENMFLQSL